MSIKAYNFPKQLTSFIGRDDDIDRLVDLINTPSCRLMTLVGAGGIGKTRLANQIGLQVGDQFGNGAYYVDLQAVQSPDMITSAIANTLRFSLSGTEELDLQLRHFLANKHMLLILDNFEHLIEGAWLLSDLLDASPDLKLVVTSREVLNLQEEWVYAVEGMDFPTNDSDPKFEQYSAVQLFGERAQRVNVTFSPDQDKQAVKRICELVGGLPLGIELAASWLRIMGAGEIVTEIQRSLDFLATSLRNIPERHRSMQAIFDHSWRLLTDREQLAFKQLSVFKGGFDQHAAAKVGDASLSLLAALVDKSLLRHDSDGRYSVHELLRQFAEAKLNDDPEAAHNVRDNHCEFYGDFLQFVEKDLFGHRQIEAADLLIRDFENIRAAWDWAIEHQNVEFFGKVAAAIEYVYQFQGRYREGRDRFEASYAVLERMPPSRERDLTMALVSVMLAWFHIRLGDTERAVILAEESREFYEKHQAPLGAGQATDPLMILGIVAAIRGDYDEAESWYKQSIAQLEARHDEANLCYSYLFLASVELSRGSFEAAQRSAEQAYMICESFGNAWFMAYCLVELGTAARANADFVTARQYYERSYTIRAGFRDPEGMGLALNSLGYTMILQNDYGQALEYYQQSHQLYSDITDRGGLGMALAGLGTATCGLGDALAARQYFQQALRIAVEIEYMPLLSFVLLNIGEMKLFGNDKSKGVELLAFVEHHQISNYEYKMRAQQLLNQVQTDIDADEFDAAITRGKSLDLDVVAANLLTRLSFDTFNRDVPDGPPASESVKQGELIDPLTPRELEILKLIADGLTNPEIAETSFITVGTVKAHINSIYSKMAVQNRVQAVTRAQDLGLV